MAPAHWLLLAIVAAVLGGIVLVVGSGRRASSRNARIGLALVLTLPAQYLLLTGYYLVYSWQEGQLICMNAGWDDVPCTLTEMLFINLFHVLVFDVMSLGIYFILTFLLILGILNFMHALRRWRSGGETDLPQPGLE